MRGPMAQSRTPLGAAKTAPCSFRFFHFFFFIKGVRMEKNHCMHFFRSRCLCFCVFLLLLFQRNPEAVGPMCIVGAWVAVVCMGAWVAVVFYSAGRIRNAWRNGWGMGQRWRTLRWKGEGARCYEQFGTANPLLFRRKLRWGRIDLKIAPLRICGVPFQTVFQKKKNPSLRKIWFYVLF